MEEKIIKKGDFESGIKDIYQFTFGPGQSVELVLESVDTHQAHAEDYECFALLFSGPKEQYLVQKTYEVAHEKLGKFPLFIVPVGTSEGKVKYEAVFNRKKVE